jgi:3-hydroxyisobutyrate dehydrogenase
MEVGLIGTGLMGLPMAERIQAAGLPLTVYNRTVAKVEPLRALGVAIAPSPDAVIQAAQCIVLMLTDVAAIREVMLTAGDRTESGDAEHGRSALAGKIIVQMGTIAPEESRALAQEFAALGCDYCEAPVLGSIPEAKTGTLIVMVGSTPEQFAAIQPVLRCFSPAPRHVGEVGTASAIKLALNQLIGGLTATFATSLAFVQQQGADVTPFMEILRDSALYAPTFDKKLQRMLDRHYANPNFPTKHLAKDMALFAQSAIPLGVNSAIPDAVQEILQATLDQGLADSDYSALSAALHPRPHPIG